MSKLASAIQYKIKSTTASVSLMFFKILSGAIIGLTLAIIGQEMVGYSTFMFTFIIVVFTGIFMRVTKNWGFLMMVMFDLFAFMSGLLLKMYILVNG
ncbi:MAG: hypothetical protein SGJ18_15045 [Pseudomonadota bacterium]|nr:hypothetical protein [Pseudomonadota bacterium]